MNGMDAEPGTMRVGRMTVEVYADPKSMGVAAARAAAASMKQLAANHEWFAVIFATGASQLGTLDALTQMKDLPWSQVCGFHLDEYAGLPIEHPASFHGYLRKNLIEKVTMKHFYEIDGTSNDPEQTCRIYAGRLRSAGPQLCLLGIGENGHLAFMDPGIADFDDPLDVKMVKLDAACRAQQVAEGWFDRQQDVPGRAISQTIPAILRVPKLIVSVPGSRKAKIVRRTLEEPISTRCPATILRNHPDVTVYLDRDSAAELAGVIPAS
jgi:glucosamine-6-phosphate deaminase